MKNLIEGAQPESLKMHYTLNYKHSINNSKTRQTSNTIIKNQNWYLFTSLPSQGFKLWNYIRFVLKSKPYKIFAKEFKKPLSDDTRAVILSENQIVLIDYKGLPISLNHDLKTFMAETVIILKLKS